MAEYQYHPVGGPPTPPESPLKEKFIAKELAHLRHVPTPPGLEATKNEDDDALQNAESLGDFLNYQAPVHPSSTTKPKIPFKSPKLQSCSSAAQTSTKTMGEMDFVMDGATQSLIQRHLQPNCCLCNQESFDKNFQGSNSGQPCWHRHETFYTHESRDGEPVETMKQTCEIRTAAPEPDGQEEECTEGFFQTGGNQVDGETRVMESDSGNDEAFAGIFV
ncbi:uncharacterized protein Z518_08857 [Rhinocladiella mackenziei CBS 650.93]|uniref:Uncharacterized protein n=1 Tax=Rhinocladiella mackenziei CBS 650.93 TaxID=1442369 RepID=A0A0D2IAQ1_9EURO|nr:uncharacterized protein Z518_08857 [Rhinocladiella mackenziei CBS 650.93]KIX02914.1 hypothetical protein Z518_08857 [Rhinocladiella mackenziei CBS 650.93]